MSETWQSKHFAIIDLDDPVGLRYRCEEPEGALCRLTCRSGDCESWCLERDDDGPFHWHVTDMADDGTETRERHPLVDMGECNALLFWENGDYSPFDGLAAEITLRVTPEWSGEDYTIEEFEVVSSDD